MQGSLDNINLFSLITVMSFLLLAPVALLRDGGLLITPSAMRAAGILDTQLVLKRAILAGFCFHAYQQVTHAPLSLVRQHSAVTGREQNGGAMSNIRQALLPFRCATTCPAGAVLTSGQTELSMC